VRMPEHRRRNSSANDRERTSPTAATGRERTFAAWPTTDLIGFVGSPPPRRYFGRYPFGSTSLNPGVSVTHWRSRKLWPEP